MKIDELVPEWKELNTDLEAAKEHLRKDEGKMALMCLASCAITCVQFAVKNELEKAIKNSTIEKA